MIPEHKQAAVKKALYDAFGVASFSGIQQLMKGLSSALIYKIIVQEKPYLLRIITRTDAMADPTHYYKCMEIAASAALAPRVHYAGIEDRISITDFIIAKPFSLEAARVKMASTLQQLHALPKFAYRNNYFDAMEKIMLRLRSSDIMPPETTRQPYDMYERVAKVYPRNDPTNLVSCHNDLKPENIIYDGYKAWPVDWEAAFLNDRYLDLAVVANFVVRNDDEEADYLARYFGEPAGEYRHARFFLMRQLLHTYYFVFHALVGSGGKPVDPQTIQKDGFRSFLDRVWDGEIDLADDDAKLSYAWVHMEQALHMAETKRFEDSLRVVSGHHHHQQ